MGKRRKKSSGQSAGGASGGAGPPSILNRKARHNYHIIESMEAGIALTGAEVLLDEVDLGRGHMEL